MAIQVEIWEKDIVEKIYTGNPHLTHCVNADQYVLAGKVVHIPQAGAAPGVQKNRSALPANVTKRTDVDITYPLDEYTSDPVTIPNADTVELSYDKRSSVLADTQLALNDTVGVVMLSNWAPSSGSRLIRTTGEAVETHLDGSKGRRRKLDKKDLKRAQLQMNRDGVPAEGRYAILDADMLDQLTDTLTDTEHRDYSRAYDEKNGVLGKLYGFTILSRAAVLRYNGSALVQPGVDGSAPDCSAALCWHTSSVEGALGEVKFFENVGDPTYYGDIYSALVRMGGRIRRADGKGVVAIVQDIAAEAWKTGTKYVKDDFVTSSGKTYICLSDHTAAADFVTDAAKWEVII